ncbi:hypothetical protein ASG84_05290 [Rhodococcus sp. Leaf278]|uniref:hypothetical protein n=1 Tax=Rhodococcus sp. Leaf278 TaxID=1736319 RepID=UPI00070C3E9B|nr:hypothetical protein [Rhodococcus sp. Leaf278]KQU49364.1 hypothetical protein ASG84_05290 [Rhodococcus sp. Leaf278]
MDLEHLVVAVGDLVIGRGTLVADSDGSLFIEPDTPGRAPESSSMARLPLIGSDLDASSAGNLVAIRGTFRADGVHLRDIRIVEATPFPGAPTLRIPGPLHTNWTRADVLDTVEHDMPAGNELLAGSGGTRNPDGSDTFTLFFLYIDDAAAAWLRRPHPGPIDVWTALTKDLRSPDRSD